jgi:hypothetical protein
MCYESDHRAMALFLLFSTLSGLNVGISTLLRKTVKDETPAFAEVDALAAVLESRHGLYAVEVAEFFSAYHSQSGDVGRSWAWAGVAESVRQRERARIMAR